MSPHRCFMNSWTEMFARDFLSIFKDRNHFFPGSAISGNTSRYLTLSMSSQFHLSLIKIDWHDVKIYIYIKILQQYQQYLIFSIISIQTRSNIIHIEIDYNLIFMQLFDVKHCGTLKNMDANVNRHFRKHAKGMNDRTSESIPSPLLTWRDVTTRG